MRQSFSALIFCAGFASATILSAGMAGVEPCAPNKLSFYETLTADSPCSIGILLFSNFTFSKSGSGATETDTDIVLTPFSNSDNVGGGFAFARDNPNNLTPPPAFTVGAGQSATYLINWYFLIDPGPVGSGADLGMDPPFGDVVITQNYCLDSQFTSFGNSLGCTGERPLETLAVDVANPFASKNFHPPAESFANVMTTIELNGITQAGSSGFDSFSSSDTVTPEPAGMVLAFTGLLGIAARRKLKPRS